MPRTENRKVTYTLEIDTAQIAALGGKTYFQTSDPQGALSMMGDAANVVVGFIPELWPENRDREKVAVKKYFMNFIETGADPGTYQMYSVNQTTGDFSSWDVTVNLKYIP
jgi:hypothetical protein